MFYAAVLLTIHLIALRQGIGVVPRDSIPSARQAFDPIRLLPAIAGLGGLVFSLMAGRSVAFSAALGIGCMLVPFVLGDLWRRRDPVATGRSLVDALAEAGNGIVIITVMLAGAQILVSLLNLTGVGVHNLIPGGRRWGPESISHRHHRRDHLPYSGYGNPDNGRIRSRGGCFGARSHVGRGRATGCAYVRFLLRDNFGDYAARLYRGICSGQPGRDRVVAGCEERRPARGRHLYCPVHVPDLCGHALDR